MNKKTFLSLSLLFLTSVSQIFAASGDSFSLHIPKNHVAIGESFELKIIKKWGWDCRDISGGNIDFQALISGNGTISMSGSSAQEVQIPGMENFRISGTSESSSCSSINGKSHSETTKIYTLIPKKPGRFTLGPVKTGDDEKTQTGTIVTIEVSGSPILPRSGDEKVSPPLIENMDTGSEHSATKPPVDSIYIISTVLLSLIGLTAWYIGRKEKNDGASVSSETTVLTESEISFPSSEKAEKYLRDYYARLSGQKTEYMTYSELLSLETDGSKRRILSDLLKRLERAHYAGWVADMDELNNHIHELRWT